MVRLSEFGVEIKGSRLLEKKRFRHASQGELLDDVARRKHSLAFLNKGKLKVSPTELEFRAFGQACLAMVRGLFPLIKTHQGTIFAAVVPRSTKKPATYEAAEYLRRDQVFLLERYFNFVHSRSETGLLVFDETDESADAHFIRQVERYFTKTSQGRFRADAIVPVPIFVNSTLTRAVQAADICIYVLNWCFRAPHGMDAEKRTEIASEFEGWIKTLQASGQITDASGAHRWYSIVYEPEPFGPTGL